MCARRKHTWKVSHWHLWMERADGAVAGMTLDVLLYSICWQSAGELWNVLQGRYISKDSVMQEGRRHIRQTQIDTSGRIHDSCPPNIFLCLQTEPGGRWDSCSDVSFPVISKVNFWHVAKRRNCYEVTDCSLNRVFIYRCCCWKQHRLQAFPIF